MTYYLSVYCRRDGVSRDGGPHDRCEADSDQKAIQRLTQSARGLLRYYDTVGCHIFCGDADSLGNPTADSRTVKSSTESLIPLSSH